MKSQGRIFEDRIYNHPLAEAKKNNNNIYSEKGLATKANLVTFEP